MRSAGQISVDLPQHVSSSTPAAQPVSDSWWASLTPAQQAELEEAKALPRKKEEEEEEKRKEVMLQRKRDELFALLDMPPEHRTPDQQSRLQALMREYRASKRKRKKNRKRRLPRTSSLFSLRRRLRQWHPQGWSFWCCPSRCVPVVGIRSGMCWLVLLATLHRFHRCSSWTGYFACQ